MSEKKPLNRKTWLTSGLRRMSYRWPARSEALKLGRVERGMYKCAQCLSTYPKQEIKLDHIQPVVNVATGFTNWDDFIDRLFCEAEGYQILCNQCHDTKTMIEDEMRKLNKSQKREELKLSEKEAKLEAKRLKALEKKESKKHG